MRPDIVIYRPGFGVPTGSKCENVAAAKRRSELIERRCPCCGHITQRPQAMNFSMGESIIYQLMLAGF